MSKIATRFMNTFAALVLLAVAALLPGLHDAAAAKSSRTVVYHIDDSARAVGAGAKPLRQPGKTDYGGYRGYFADPDGHVWEVVQAPGFDFTDDGRLILPD